MLPLTAPEVRQRVESSVTDLDDAIRLLRRAIFGLEQRLDRHSLRQQVLRLCGDRSPVPEIAFAGPVDEALPPQVAGQLAGETLRVVVTGAGTQRGSAARDNTARDFFPLRNQADQAGIEIEIEPAADGTRLAWSFPLQTNAPGKPSLPLPAATS